MSLVFRTGYSIANIHSVRVAHGIQYNNIHVGRVTHGLQYIKIENKERANTTWVGVSEWLLFNSKMSKSSAMSYREHVTFNIMMVMSILFKTTTLRWNCIVPTHLCSLSPMMCAYWRSNKCRFHSLWFHLTGVRSHDLPHSRRAG